MTFLDRPYRRLVDDLPVRYVGFTVPDEFFVGYGFDLDERTGTCRTCTSPRARAKRLVFGWIFPPGAAAPP